MKEQDNSSNGEAKTEEEDPTKYTGKIEDASRGDQLETSVDQDQEVLEVDTMESQTR